MTAYRKSILFRLNGLVLAAVLPALAVILFQSWKNHQAVVENTRGSLLQLAQAVAFQHEGEVHGLGLLLTTIAQVPCVRNGEGSQCEELFRSSLEKNPFLRNIVLTTPDGRVIGSGVPLPPGTSFADRKFFRDAISTGLFSPGEYEPDHTRWYPPLNFGLPIRADGGKGRITGVLVASLDLDVFAGFCRRLNLPEGSSFNLSDHRGILLYRFPRHETVVPGTPDRPELRAHVTGAAEEGSFFAIGRDDVPRLLAFKRLRISPGSPPYLYIRMTVPEQAIREVVRKDSGASLLLLALSTVAALSASWVLGGVIIGRRLEQLVSATRRLGQGDRQVTTGIPHDGSEIGQVAASFDDMVRRLEALDHLQEQMRNAQKLESLGVLAGGIAHDFNNLLTVILGNIDVVLSDPRLTDPKARNKLAEADKAAQRAADLCRQMLAYAGLGQFSAERARLDEILSGMASLLGTSISKKAKLRMSLEPGIPAVSGDPGQIRQVVMNLVVNASEALEGGEGEITVSTGTRRLDRRFIEEEQLDKELPEGLYAWMEVRDTGCGMTPETQARIFDPFFSTRFTGRGLGLAAVLGIVRAHRGGISVRSREGLGTAVTVFLPAVEEAAPAPAAEAAPTEAWSGSGKVLLVDDEEMVRNVGAEMLGTLGFGVIEAADGVEALELFQASRAEFTLVVLDLTMPRMDGEETLKALRAIDPAVPVLIASGYSEEGNRGRFAGQKGVDFIPKPYRIAELRARIRQLLEGG